MTKTIGNQAEAIACDWLHNSKITIKEKNFYSRYGEIDIIALEGRTLCFIEVRYRRRASFGSAAETVTAPKRNKLARTANYYLMKNPCYTKHPCRFDIIAIHGDLSDPKIDWYKNAFIIDPCFH